MRRKAAGKKITAPHKHDEPVVINLMDALRRSLARVQHGTKEARNGKAQTSRKRHTVKKKTG